MDYSVNKGVMTGNLLNETGFSRDKQVLDDAATLKDGGVLGEIELAARNSALGTLGVTIGNKLLVARADLPEDPTFKQGLFERIRTDLPDVTDTEQDQLMGVGNVHEYNLYMDAAKRRRKEQRLASQSGLATGLEIALDVLPELAIGVRLSGALTKFAAGAKLGTRLGLAAGANAVAGGAYEYGRQRASLEQTNDADVAQMALISGVVGGLMDSGMRFGRFAAADRRAAQTAVGDVVNGGKPVADVVADDVAEAAVKQADMAAQVADSPALKAIAEELTGTGAKQLESVDALLAATRQLDADSAGPLQKAFMDLQDRTAAQGESLLAAQGPKVLDDAAAPAPASLADNVTTPPRVETSPEEAARIETVMKDLESTSVKSPAEQAWEGSPATTAVAPRVTAAESAAAPSLTEGRLRLKVGDKHVKPRFESPVDRALATLGSKVADDGLMVDALETLKKAFPGEDNDTLVSMASDYVDSLLMPRLRTTNGAPTIGRFWDQLDAAKYRDGYEESVKELNAALKPLLDNNGPAVAEHIARHVDDADGTVLKASVSKANKFVTNQTLSSNFKFLQKSNKVLADTLNARIAAITAETGAAPDLRTVRTLAAKEMYGRAMFDKQVKGLSKQGGFIEPKVLFLLAGGGVLAMSLIPTDANAAGGAVASSTGALTAILQTGTVLLGGKALLKVMAGKGLLTKAVKANLDEAALLKAQGADDATIKATTKVEYVGGQPHYELAAQDIPELAQQASLQAEHLDELVSSFRNFTADGEPVKVVSHFDEDKTIRTLSDLDKAPIIRAETTVFGKKVRVKVPDVVSSDATAARDDKSALLRSVSMLFMSNIVPRLGRKAVEMASDHLYKSIKTEALGRVESSFHQNFGAWFKESGRKKPMNPLKIMDEQEEFGRAIARAKEFPNEPGVSQAAKAVADEMAKVEAEVIGRMKQLVAEMEGRGIKFPENNALKQASVVDPKADFVSRLVSKKAMDNVEAKIGRAGVVSLIRQSFENANAGVPVDKLDDVAEGIYESLVRSHDNVGVHLPKDQGAALTAKLRAQGLDDATIDTVSKAFGLRESGRTPAALKERRVELDLSASKTFGVDGQQVTVRMDELYERNAISLFSRWMNTMAGLEAVGTAGAKHGVNLTDNKVWGVLEQTMKQQGASEKNLRALNAYRNMMLGAGRDTEYFGVASSFERTVRTMSTFWLGSNFVLAQAGDVGGMGTRALKNLFKGVKAAHELRKGIQAGTLSGEELKSVAAWMDLGLDSVSASVANAAESTSDIGANLADQAVHKAMQLNGMHFVGRAVTAVKGLEVQEFMGRYALGEAVDDKLWKHYATMGLDKALADQLAPFVKKHMIVDPDTGVFRGIDKKGWMAEDLLSARQFEMFIKKAGNAANSQSSGFGETAAFFRSSVAGRFLGQIQGTAMFATQRSLGEVYNFDSYVMNAWLTSMAFAAGSYMARIGMRYANDPGELEQRLSYEQIFLASVRMSSFAGVGPNVIDALLNYSGIMPGGFFAGGTGKTGSGELSVQAAVKAPITAIAGLAGLLKFDPSNAYTQGEAMALQRTIAPLWWLQPVMTFATKDMATKNPKKPAEAPGIFE